MEIHRNFMISNERYLLTSLKFVCVSRIVRCNIKMKILCFTKRTDQD